MRSLALISLLLFSLDISGHSQDEITIVSWNASPAFYEALENRSGDFQSLSDDLQPDVLVLIEVTGYLEVQRIAEFLGWDQYYGIVSNQATAKTSAYEALETAVISRIPITRVIEHDTQADGHHEVFNESGSVAGLVSEEVLSSDGIDGFGQTLSKFDRGTMRVDLEGNLSLFPVHLKSNRNNECFDLADATAFLKRQGFSYDPAADAALISGFESATRRSITNAEKRERVIAAVARVAAVPVEEGRTTVILGDFNTAFEPGKYGRAIDDCALQNFSCAKAPFPANACEDGDGFDDTLGLLEAGLVSGQSWTFLSKEFGRTYRDEEFADAAIDHFAVNSESADSFTNSFVADELYGSDHYPIVTTLARE